MDAPRFIADENVGKLGRYLRRLGFDTALFGGGCDRDMVKMALAEGRIILTRDTRIAGYGAALSGRVRVLTFASDSPRRQLERVLDMLNLAARQRPFSRCLECNAILEERTPAEVAGRVPPYVLATQRRFREGPACRRLYWRGTHWRAMRQQLGDSCD